MKKILYCLLMASALIYSCKKSNTQPADGFAGKWQWLIGTDGFGHISTPATAGNNQTLLLNADSTYAFSLNNAVTDDGNFHIGKKTDPTAFGTGSLITFQQIARPQSTYSKIIYLKNDTLILTTTFSWEGSVSRYVRMR